MMTKLITVSFIIILTALSSASFAYNCDAKRPMRILDIQSGNNNTAVKINNISDVNTQNQYTITGTFSAKSNNALLYLDGTEGNLGDTVPGLELGVINYHIDNTRAYSGTVSLFADANATNEGIYNRFIFDTPQPEIYFSYLTYIEVIAPGDPSINPQLKLGRLNMDVNSHTGRIFAATWGIPDTLGISLVGYPQTFGARDGSPLWDATPMINTWVRHEGYIKMLGVENNILRAAASYRMYLETGEVIHRFRGWPIFSLNMPSTESDSTYYDNPNISDCHLLTYNSGDPTEFVQFILPFFKRRTTDLDIWVDDVYLNTSPERVEICDSPSWKNCTIRVLQNTISRTNNSITFKYNPAHLNKAGDLYVYVINRDGAYNKTGGLLPK